jgi:hypothetical protein
MKGVADNKVQNDSKLREGRWFGGHFPFRDSFHDCMVVRKGVGGRKGPWRGDLKMPGQNFLRPIIGNR